MKNKKGFTLIELLAVIVVLAIILVIAVPRILETIKQSKIGAIQSSTKLIAKTAEQKQLENESIGSTNTISCTGVAEYNTEDYGDCNITFNNNIATVTLKGKTGGRFEGLTCTGTKDNVTCTESESSEPEWVYAFNDITNASQGVEDYTDLKDSNGNQRGVFVKVKSDLSEKYVCTMFDSSKEDGFGTEPHCLLSKGAYNTRNEANSQWSKVKTMFNDVDGSKNICYEGLSNVYCRVNLSASKWDCNAHRDGYVDCGRTVDGVHAGCIVNGVGGVNCYE